MNDRAAASESTPHSDFRVADTPWFWLALFGTVALLAMTAVGQKYAQRQMRIEMRHAHRLETQAERTARVTGKSDGVDRVEAPLAAQTPNPRATLRPLFVLFGAMAGIGYVGLAFAWRRHVLTHGPAGTTSS